VANSLQRFAAPRKTRTGLPSLRRCSTRLLRLGFHTRTARTHHAGELHRAGPPPPWRTSPRASPPRARGPGGLRMPRTPSQAKLRPKAPPECRISPTPVRSSATPPREATSGDPVPPPRAPSLLSRQILHGRPRLEPELNRSGPLDRDPTAWIQGYRFSLALFLKRP